MAIPREKGLVRLYIQLADIRPARGERFDRSAVTEVMIFDAARKILLPYKISYHLNDCVFIAGDAVHTYSHKAGQGKNFSMQDTYNLVWKIGAVVQKTASRSPLSTYESERRMLALQLVDFDPKFSHLFSGRPAKGIADDVGISIGELREALEQGNRFTSQISLKYEPSLAVAECPSDKNHRVGVPAYLVGLTVGMRFPSFQVVCQCGATPRQLGDVLESDGLWRLIVFSGAVTSRDIRTLSRTQAIGDRLLESESPLNNAAILPLLVHASARREVELLDMPRAFYTQRNTDAYDYHRVFPDDLSYRHGHGHAYEKYGLDKGKGRLVLVRPDHYISWEVSWTASKQLRNSYQKP
ncbi:uncharacterized protein A1O9_07997 [Exophiala aquamarina CBS 119918]|uniref:FAD-binding domain-containing protein n=1 Tax=Exophiala aquamarina CBS 119918 TaxID=1182545 RepID=A0A072P970_9EURO|nr:uncharacterized protein A1O9_07997 [Exophiala aquamarina CBS 119918]KEF56416.1 hypothetical protein A1O9_07997 [Exophiala aquamarina CBS 119918]